MITDRVNWENLRCLQMTSKAGKKDTITLMPKRRNPNKKGQEEIMGFILVVVMVMVIGLGFLFFLTPKAPERQDLEMQNLLYAWLSTTIEGKDISSMIENCYGACDLSKETVILDNAIDAKFGRGASSLNGYSLNVTGTAEFYYSKGNLTGNYRTAFVPVKDNDVRLKFYLP